MYLVYLYRFYDIDFITFTIEFLEILDIMY